MKNPLPLPLAIVIGSMFLQACVTTPTRQQAAVVHPLFEIRHSADKDSATYARLGKYHQERGNPDLARAAYVHAVTLDPRQLTARTQLAAMDAGQGKLDQAKAALQQLVSEFPDAAHPYNNLGYVLYLQGDFNGAVSTLERAVALDSTNERARNNLSMARAAAGVQHELATMLNTLPALENSPVQKPPVALPPASNSVITFVEQAVVIPARRNLTQVETKLVLVRLLPNVYELRRHAVPDAGRAQFTAPVQALVNADRVRQLLPIAGRLEIANGNGVSGMALHVSHLLAGKGITVAYLSNSPPYTQQSTEIQYRAGHEKQALALKEAIRGENIVMKLTQLGATADVRLMLGKDVVTSLAPAPPAKRIG